MRYKKVLGSVQCDMYTLIKLALEVSGFTNL